MSRAGAAGRPPGVDGLEGAVDDVSWMRPILRGTLGDSAYGAIRSALAGGRLRPGEPLLLRPTARRFGISATPMREALQRLISERALAMDGRGTATVPTLTAAEVREIGALRADLEGRAAAWAAERAPIEAVEDFAEAHERVEARHAAGDIPGAVRANAEFHLTLCAMAGAPILLELVENLWVRSGPILFHAIDRRLPRWGPGPHLALLAALEARDPAAARAAMEADALRWAETYVQFAAPDARDAD